MIERPIPQDVMKYKAKLIGNLSIRQCVAVVLCGVAAIPGYFLLGENMETPVMTMVMTAIPALPFYIIGFMPIMGLPAEQVAMPLLFDNFIAPAVRKKEIHNKEYERYCKLNYDQLQIYNEKLRRALASEDGSLEAFSAEMDKEEEENKKNKKKKKKNDKFKVTKSPEYKGIK